MPAASSLRRVGVVSSYSECTLLRRPRSISFRRWAGESEIEGLVGRWPELRLTDRFWRVGVSSSEGRLRGVVWF